MPRPTTLDEFREWSSESTCGKLDRTFERWYANTQNNLYTQVEDNKFLSAIPECLRATAVEFSERHAGGNLFRAGRNADVSIDWNRKASGSFLEKLFRLNVVENLYFPEPPDGGWISPVSSLRFGAIDDVVRTTLVVAYADAPKFLAEALSRSAAELGLSCKTKDHSKEKGYYAYHFYVGVPVDVANLHDRSYVELPVPVEIQITTELQAALREVTHRLYESERLSGGPSDGWKEQFASGRFRAAYMAHSLRFIEAMIVELRGKTPDEGGES